VRWCETRRVLTWLVPYRCTTGQVRVHVMPSTAWILATTSLPSSSTLLASARTMTSYGPVTSSAEDTPLMAATSFATWAAFPTSVWIRMYALTMSPPLPVARGGYRSGLRERWHILTWMGAGSRRRGGDRRDR